MKKMIICLIALSLCVGMLCTTACASPEEGSLLELLIEMPYAGGIVPELNPDYFPAKLKDYSVEGKPILVTFNTNGWYYAAQPELDAAIDEACREGAIDYMVLDEMPVRICKLTTREEYHSPVFDEIPVYISDIMNGSVKQAFCGDEYTIKNLICFDSASSLKGVIVYYITDGGVFVRYYENYTSQAVEFAFEKFQPYAEAYHEITTSYEYNYDENGSPKTGGISFIDFIQLILNFIICLIKILISSTNIIS